MMWHQIFSYPEQTFGINFSNLFLGSLAWYGSSVDSNSPRATTLNGTYVGIHNTNYSVDAFLGIPYAQPPVGDLRFRVPKPINSTWSGVRPAKAYGNQCVGYGNDNYRTPVPTSEDCLTLNVVRPAGFERERKLPVAVWIHGGGFFEGTSANPRYNLSFVVQHSAEIGHPFIGVSINYRLHSWGFLFSKEIKDEKVANLGFRDQRAALIWIQENIVAFGGDPSKVTIWGESAGGASVGAHLIAFGGRDDGLFRGAIAQSGSTVGFGRYLSAEAHQQNYQHILKAALCDNAADTLDCLRHAPFDTLNNIFNASRISHFILPTIDEDFIVQSSTSSLLAGRFIKVPLLTGTNTDEGTSFAREPISTNEQFLSFLNRFTLSPSTSTTLSILYPDIPTIGIPSTLPGRPGPEFGAQYKRVAAFIGDHLFHAPRRFMNQIWADHGVKSWSYRFNTIPAGVRGSVGVNHFQEVAWTMYNLRGEGYVELGGVRPFEGVPESYIALARLMVGKWARFVECGDPNDCPGNLPASTSNIPHWLPYGPNDSAQNYVLDANVTGLAYMEKDIFRAEAMDYLMKGFVDLFGR